MDLYNRTQYQVTAQNQFPDKDIPYYKMADIISNTTAGSAM